MGRIFSVKPSPFEVDHAMAIHQAVVFQGQHDGDLPNTPIWRMLERRFDAHPARFEFFHPNISLMIERSQSSPPVFENWNHCMQLPEVVCQPPSESFCPVNLQPQTVPEPSAGLMLGLSVVCGLILHHWSRGWV